MRVLFWIFSSLLAALVVHLSYILFVPSRNFSASVDRVLKAQHENAFAVLDGNLQASLMPYAAQSDLVILCKYDVSKGAVRLDMTVPEGHWSLDIYTIRGRQVYALNDRQADSREFSVTLEQEASLLATIMGGGIEEPDVTSENVGWRVALGEDKGLAMLWMPLSDKWRRLEALRVLEKSKCAAVGAG